MKNSREPAFAQALAPFLEPVLKQILLAHGFLMTLVLMLTLRQSGRAGPESRSQLMSRPAAEAPRKFPRQRTLKGARMMCEGTVTFDVTIRDMSEGGVKLKLPSPFVVPPTFKLLILNPNTGIADTRACETRWQRGDQVGAHFIEASPEQATPEMKAPSLRRPPAD